MTLKSPSLFSVIVSLLVTFLLLDVSAVLGGRMGALLGGWQPIKDPNDPQVREIGEFAVTQHNKQAKTDLEFESVVSGETQVVSGINYRLVISAKDGAVLNNYEAVVWDKPSNSSYFSKPCESYRNLTSFKSV